MNDNEFIFCQTLTNVELLNELFRREFLNSDYYKQIWADGSSNSNIFRKVMNAPGLGNPAMLQMFLYGLLVMPRELVGDDFCKDEFNNEAKNYVEEYSSSYDNEGDRSMCNYYRHIRNAVAHSKCEYVSDDKNTYVIFYDQDNRNHSCQIKMKTSNVGRLFDFLRIKLMEYINDNM